MSINWPEVVSVNVHHNININAVVLMPKESPLNSHLPLRKMLFALCQSVYLNPAHMCR